MASFTPCTLKSSMAPNIKTNSFGTGDILQLCIAPVLVGAVIKLAQIRINPSLQHPLH